MCKTQKQNKDARETCLHTNQTKCQKERNKSGWTGACTAAAESSAKDGGACVGNPPKHTPNSPQRHAAIAAPFQRSFLFFVCYCEPQAAHRAFLFFLASLFSLDVPKTNHSLSIHFKHPPPFHKFHSLSFSCRFERNSAKKKKNKPKMW